MEKCPFRPHICPDNKCNCIWSTWTRGGHERGQSWDCVGKLLKPHTFQWAETEHVNQYCWCIYSPLKGITKFLITDKDTAVFIGTLSAMLLQENPKQLVIILKPILFALRDKGFINIGEFGYPDLGKLKVCQDCPNRDQNGKCMYAGDAMCPKLLESTRIKFQVE